LNNRDGNGCAARSSNFINFAPRFSLLMIAFGPIPSRRLGRSLGINNIPPKYCSYSCVYCQVGKAMKMDIHRDHFYQPEYILEQTREKIRQAEEKGEKIDYLSLVPDGEPTLDINLGEIITGLKTLEYPVAVITNSTLLWRTDVQNELLPADWISVKIDAITEAVWKKIDRPYKSLELPVILKGIVDFRKKYNGIFTTETMLAKGYNNRPEEMEKIARFIAALNPHNVYLSIPTRPPAVKSVKPPDETFLNAAFHIFKQHMEPVELLIGYEGNAFAFTGNAHDDILSITAVHPLRREAVDQLLTKSGNNWELVDHMLENGELIKTEYEGSVFFIRKLRQKTGE